MNLRQYQDDALHHAYLAETKEKLNRLLVAMPTGTGKTVVFGQWINERQGRAVVLAHRDELIRQAVHKLKMILPPDVTVGVIKAEEHEPEAEVVVASVQSLRAGRLADLKDVTAIVVDEAHHSEAPSYQRILKALGAFDGVMTLGVTATPFRGDGKDLSATWQKIVYHMDIRAAIKDGHLCGLRAYRVATRADFHKLKIKHGDFAQGQAGAELMAAGAPEQIAEAVKTYAEGRPTIIFCPTVEVSQEVEAAVRKHRPCLHVDASTDPGTRTNARELLSKGGVVTNCGIYTEGFDAPEVSCVVVARPTKSQTLYVQMVGRGTRNHPGKEDCVAEGQRVLTDHGLIPIEQVTKQMWVWDGVDYVEHGGAICRGWEDTITYAGLTATPDHKVWTKEGWVPFGTCASQQTPIAITEAKGQAIWETDGRFRQGVPTTWTPDVEDVLSYMRRGESQKLRSCDEETSGVSFVCEASPNTKVAAATMPFGKRSLYESQEQTLQDVWRTWDHLRLSRADSHGSLDHETSRTQAPDADRPNREQQRLCSRQSTLGFGLPESVEHDDATAQCETASSPSGTPRDQVCRQHDSTDALRGQDRGANHQTVPQALVQTKRRVWDILNAGPNHRFTCEGLLVSNCIFLDVVGATMRHELCTARILAVGASEEEQRAEAITHKRREQEQERTSGPIDAVEIDLWGARPFNWIKSSIGYLLSVGEHGSLLLGQDGNAWAVWLKHKEETRKLWKGNDLGYGQGFAEDWVRERGLQKLCRKDTDWRNDPCTKGQQAIMSKMRIPWTVATTKGQASDAISFVMANRGRW